MAIFLNETDVGKLATMNMAMEAVESSLKLHGEQKADNAPRRRCRIENGFLHVMSASIPSLGYAGLKSYTSVGGEIRFHVHLYDAGDGRLLAIMEGDLLGQMRTGAASGVAAKYMARKDASRVGIYGTGRQAPTQLEAICAVRPIQTIIAYGRDPERRADFCRRMSESLGVSVYPAASPEDAVKDMDIVITATTSKTPVFSGSLIAQGTHINAVGANFAGRQEIDVETVRRSACVIVDSVEQSMLESGDLIRAAEEEAFYWEDARELGVVVAGEFPGREDDTEITLFKSNGIALEDVALAARVYEAALRTDIGRSLPF